MVGLVQAGSAGAGSAAFAQGCVRALGRDRESALGWVKGAVRCLGDQVGKRSSEVVRLRAVMLGEDLVGGPAAADSRRGTPQAGDPGSAPEAGRARDAQPSAACCLPWSSKTVLRRRLSFFGG